MAPIHLLGHRINLSAEDLFFPSCCCWLLFDLPVLVLLGTCRALQPAATFAADCTEAQQRNMASFGAAGLALWLALLALDLAIMALACRTRLFVRNPRVEGVLNCRVGLLVFQTVYLLLSACPGIGTFWGCLAWHSPDPSLQLLSRLALGAVLYAVALLLINIVGICCALTMARIPLNSTSIDWLLRNTLCCHWRLSTRHVEARRDRDALHTMATILGSLLHQEDLVPSDILAGLLLLQVHQSARRRNGERFVGLAGPEDGVARADWQEYRTSTLEDALRGMQPHLTAGDWHRLREANYYGKYALEGAYGWTGWVASSCWDPRRLCICRRPSPSAPGAGDGRCRAASLGRHVAGAVRGCRGLLRCSPGLACAACDVSVFLRLTDVDVPDLVIFNDTAQVHRPAYFVCVDRGRKALVVTVKGSTSINDFITDMDATNVPFPQAPLRGYYAHEGMLHSAMDIKAEIDGKEILLPLLLQNPEYNCVLVGHSLGAGVATLLTVLYIHDPHYAQVHDRFRCFAYGAPCVLDPRLSVAPAVCRIMTSIAHSNDAVCRIGVANVSRLRTEARQHLERVKGKTTKWHIMRDLLHMALADPDRPLDDAHLAHQLEYSDLEPVSPVSVVSDTCLTVDDVDAATEPAPCCAGGRIYHILPVERPNGQGARYTVYPAAQSVFQEIVLAPRMFENHLPWLYRRALASLPYSFHGSLGAAAAAAGPHAGSGPPAKSNGGSPKGPGHAHGSGQEPNPKRAG